MKILFFGNLGDRIGREIELDLPHGRHTVASLREHLAELYPQAADDLSAARLRACVEDSMVSEDHPVPVGGSVEFFPPLSGG